MVKYIQLILLLLTLSYSQENTASNTGLAKIDSLPTYDWDVKDGGKSYLLGGLYSVFPGGGQYYTGHYIRGGFITAIETYLLLEIFQTQPLRTDNQVEAINIQKKHLQNLFRLESPIFFDSILSIKNSIQKIRTSEDALVEIQDLKNSQISWLFGIHLYSILDSYEDIYTHNNGHSIEKKSALTAMALSTLIPGAGQIYNGSYSKAGLLYMSLFGSYVSFHSRQNVVDHYLNRVQLTRIENNDAQTEFYQEKLTFFRKKRNQYIWAPLLFYFYSIADAATDALLSDFDNPNHIALLPYYQYDTPGLYLSFNF
jgi:hypothetical protein